MAEEPVSLLFVCVGNMCRSPLAEAYARHYGGERVQVGSAGIAATGQVHPIVLELLRERGIATEGLASKSLDEVEVEGFDWVVSMAGIRAEAFVPEGYRGQTRFWPIMDPMGRSREIFEEVARDVEAHVLGLLKELGIVERSVGMSGWGGWEDDENRMEGA